MCAKKQITMRLDKALVVAGLARSRDDAIEMIAMDMVRVNGAIAQKATRQVRPNDELYVSDLSKRYVGRGAYKLLGALDDLKIACENLIVADVGSSTGGFTQVLLERGAQLVVAIDVGIAQMSERLRQNSRVLLLEGVNARTISRDRFELPKIDLVVGDLSFISLTRLKDSIQNTLLEGNGRFLLLVKPQFELDRRSVSKGKGIIKDPDLWAHAIYDVAQSYSQNGAVISNVVASKLSGSMGNREFFISGYFGEDLPNCGGNDLGSLVERAVASVVSETDGSSSLSE